MHKSSKCLCEFTWPVSSHLAAGSNDRAMCKKVWCRPRFLKPAPQHQLQLQGKISKPFCGRNGRFMYIYMYTILYTYTYGRLRNIMRIVDIPWFHSSFASQQAQLLGFGWSYPWWCPEKNTRTGTSTIPGWYSSPQPIPLLVNIQ